MTDLCVQLTYHKEDDSRPFLFCRPMSEQERLFYSNEVGGERDLVDVLVRDGRKQSLTLDRYIFIFIKDIYKFWERCILLLTNINFGQAGPARNQAHYGGVLQPVHCRGGELHHSWTNHLSPPRFTTKKSAKHLRQ